MAGSEAGCPSFGVPARDERFMGMVGCRLGTEPERVTTRPLALYLRPNEPFNLASAYAGRLLSVSVSLDHNFRVPREL